MKDKTKKILWIVIIIVGVILLVCSIPLWIDKLYNINPLHDFFFIKFSQSDILLFSGSALTFIGSTILGVLTLYQNKKSQEKTDEINRLQLELQRKSMRMAEEQLKKDTDIQQVPKFEVTLKRYNGNYSNLCLSLKNVCSIIVSNITPIDVIIKDKNIDISNATKFATDLRSLSPSQEAIIKTNTTDISIPNNYRNLDLIFNFSCEDENGKIHYYQAVSTIPDPREFSKEIFNVSKIG